MPTNYTKDSSCVKTSLPLIVTLYLCACSSGDSIPSATSWSAITNAIFDRTEPNCSAYIGTYSAQVKDVSNDKNFTSSVTVTANGNDCTFSSNSIPNHDFNDASADLATPVAEVSESFNIPGAAVAASSTTALSLTYDNAVFLNGVKLDMLAAACYGIGNEPLGQEKIGCFEDKPWRYDPMFSLNSFGTDNHNAHTQPDGAYHYHGDPKAMYDTTGTVTSPVIGFAADGFPIFGPFIDDNGIIRRVKSGYTLKSGLRISQNAQGAFPGGEYDGTYRDDYEFTDNGDLDKCNGMTKGGSYAYYVTDSFPWILGCFTGTPDESFKKSGGTGPPSNGQRPPPR
jgi:hypothetical protein